MPFEGGKRGKVKWAFLLYLDCHGLQQHDQLRGLLALNQGPRVDVHKRQGELEEQAAVRGRHFRGNVNVREHIRKEKDVPRSQERCPRQGIRKAAEEPRAARAGMKSRQFLYSTSSFSQSFGGVYRQSSGLFTS